jgi:ribosomal protein S18 acetylase RimI-like enzyme
MKLQKATFSQISTIEQLARAIWPIAYAEILSLEQLDYMLNMFYSEEALRSQMEQGQVFYLAFNDTDKAVGFVAYEVNCQPHKTKIHKIYVLLETQGSGVGKLLFEKVKEIALQNEQNAIFLNVNKYNTAQHFYTKLGFKVIKDEVIEIGRGYIMDDYVMEVEI